MSKSLLMSLPHHYDRSPHSMRGLNLVSQAVLLYSVWYMYGVVTFANVRAREPLMRMMHGVGSQCGGVACKNVEVR